MYDDVINSANFLSQSVQGFWFCGGRIFPHRKEKSPLTPGLNYRSACDVYGFKISFLFFYLCLFPACTVHARILCNCLAEQADTYCTLYIKLKASVVGVKRRRGVVRHAARRAARHWRRPDWCYIRWYRRRSTTQRRSRSTHRWRTRTVELPRRRPTSHRHQSKSHVVLIHCCF